MTAPVRSYVMKPMSLARLLAVGLFVTVAWTSTPRADDVDVKMFAPRDSDTVGAAGFGWFVDLAVKFGVPLERTGFSGFQLTGPGAHNDVGPFPGTFSVGADDRMPGLIVLVSMPKVGAGSCQNIANLFNLTGIADRSERTTELWDTWIVGAPNFGMNTPSTVLAAVAADRNGNGVFDDAPSVILDADGNGICDEGDLQALGLASGIAKARIFIAP
jgi:hypothetical protein